MNEIVVGDEEGRRLLDEMEERDDVWVTRIRTLVLDDETHDNFCAWQGCYTCGQDIEVGDTGVVWGAPFGENLAEIKACQHVSVSVYCSSTCAEVRIADFAEGKIEHYVIGHYR